MEYFAGLDVSVKKTSVCILNAKGDVLKEAKVDSDPEALSLFLYDQNVAYERVGLEAGPLSQWLYAGMAKAKLPVICVETRHAKAMMSAQINKTDRNDARGIANMMRAGMYKPVHVKTEDSQKIRALLAARKFVQSKMIDAENHIRGLLRNFGLKVGAVSRKDYEKRILELIEGDAVLSATIRPMLEVRRSAREQYAVLHQQMLELVRYDAVCLRLMTCPGVGPFVALTFKTTIDIPDRFRRSRSVGAHIGLTPRRYQSGEMDVAGHISKCGDADLRTALVEAAMIILTVSKRNSTIRAWGLKLAKRRGLHRATCAVARRLAVILHRMWVDETDYRWADGKKIKKRINLPVAVKV